MFTNIFGGAVFEANVGPGAARKRLPPNNREISFEQADAIRNDCQRIFDERWNCEHGNAFEEWTLPMTVDGIIDWMADFPEIILSNSKPKMKSRS